MGARARIETGTAFELVLSTLHVADPSARDRFVEAAEWARLRGALGNRRLRTLEHIGAHPVFNLTGLAWDVAPPRTAARLMDHLRAIGPVEVMLTALGMYRRVYRRLTPPDVTRLAASGDRAARREFLRTAWPDIPEWQTSARFLLSQPADELGAAFIDELETWQREVFAPEEVRLAEAQERRRDELLAERDTWSVDALVARALPGLDYVPPSGVAEVIFVPDSVIRPAMVLVDHRADFVATFPITLAEGESDSPPEQLVRLGKALGDEMRLRALRILARGPMTIVELASELGVPRTTLSHHIGVLRGAGLITLGVDDGRWGRLRLRAAGIDDAPGMLHRYLAGGEADGEEPSG